MSESAKEMCLKTSRRMVLERDKRFSLVRHATGLGDKGLRAPGAVRRFNHPRSLRGVCNQDIWNAWGSLSWSGGKRRFDQVYVR